MTMGVRPKTLEATVALYAFLFEAALLLGSFTTIDFFLWRSLRNDLRGTAGQELEGLMRFITDHEAGGRGYLLDEMAEHLGPRTNVVIQVLEGGESLFASSSLSGEMSGVRGAFFPGPKNVYWVEGADFRGFELRVGVPAGAELQARGRWRIVMGFCSLGGLLLAALLAHVLARHATAPLAAIGEAAERVNDQNLSERLPRPGRAFEEVERVRRSFDQMMQRLETSVQKLRQFTADASHELRTPLAVLKVQAQAALASGELEPEAETLIRSQLEEIDRLTAMVEDLLTLARLDSGKPELSAVDVADVVLETVEQFRAVADARGIDFAVTEIDPALVVGERSQLRRLVSNLLDNALKYTEKGGRVRVELGRKEDLLRLVVADTGRGIPETDLPRIFERFYRADPSRSRRSGGVGLGLAIVARIAEFHGGTVSVSSKPDEGSSFVVELPAVQERTTLS
jgi:signal transduction histidine kinase